MAEKDLSGREAIEQIRKLTDGIHIAMLTTVAEDGRLHARPMATQTADFDGTLYFLANIESGKVAEIRDDADVLVAYAEPKDGKYLSLQGVARVNRDREAVHRHWSDAAKAWFPGGKDDPNAAVIEVRVTGGEYWSSSASSVVRLTKLAAAAVLGADQVSVGDAGKLQV